MSERVASLGSRIYIMGSSGESVGSDSVVIQQLWLFR